MTRMRMCCHIYAHSNVPVYAGFREIFDPQPHPRPQNLQVGLETPRSYLTAVQTTAVYWYVPAPESSLGSLVGRCTMGCLAVIGTHRIKEEEEDSSSTFLMIITFLAYTWPLWLHARV